MHRAIIGGQPGSVNGVVKITTSNGTCTGSEVSVRVILTAGHCIYERGDRYKTNRRSFRVHLQYSHQTLRVARYFRFPGWGYDARGIIDNDGAVLILRKPNARERVLPIATAEPPAGTSVMITGYGVLSAGSTAPAPTPYYAYSTVQSYAFCSTNTQMSVDNLCVLDYPYYADTISGGDSGGPLLARAAAGNLFIAGINDTAVADDDPRYPQTFVRVDTYRQWILNKIQQWG
ncbi:MAG TPA: S1 family peptidase [Solirubrobacteraceae bacterium]|nr:S1 family peptidase [Solirubrobacteraceae bacterium]